MNIAIEIAARDAASGVVGGITNALGGLGNIAAGAVSHALGNVLTGALNMAAQGIQNLGGVIVDSVGQASSLAESTSKIGVVFGDSAKEVMAFAETAATALGQSKNQALEAAGTYGNLLTSIGVLPDAAADMSTSLVTLASDLASFNNASPEDTLNALRSALTGETEPMKRFGVALSAAAVEQQALAMGLIHSKKELTPAIKAQATYALLLEQTTNAQGDFARTSDGLANRQRIMAAQWADLQTTLGQMALPVFEAFTELATDSLVPMLGEMMKKLEPLGPVIARVAEGVASAISALVDGEDFSGAADALVEFIAPFVSDETSAGIRGFGEAIDGVIGWVQANLPLMQATAASVFGSLSTIFGAFSGFVTGVLVPAFNAMFGGIVGQAPTMQQVFTGVLMAIQTGMQMLAGFVTGVLIPAMTAAVAWIVANWPLVQAAFAAVFAWIEANVFPIIASLIAWIQEKIPVAVGLLVSIWEGVLLPAMDALWTFVQTTLLPALEGLYFIFVNGIVPVIQATVDVVIALLEKGLMALHGFWEKTLQPFLTDTVIPMWESFSGWLTTVTGGLDGIISALTSVKTWLESVGKAIGALRLPDWLTPGSPTPFENGLRGIADAMQDVDSVALPRLSGNLQMGKTPLLAAPGSAGGGSVSNVTFNINGGDPQAAANAVLRALTDVGLISETRLR